MIQPSTASAPAKLILCGEHAVVYGRPAIALPLGDVRATARVAPGAPGAGLWFAAPDLGGAWAYDAEPDNPLSELAIAALRQIGAADQDLTITLSSAIPIASGMGSGAAIGTALVRALATACGHSLSVEQVAALVYESERRYHGTPSGIDNTVVAHERAIWYQRRWAGGRRPAANGQQGDGRQTTDDQTTLALTPLPPVIEPVPIGAPLTLVIGDTGVRSATRLPVGRVRERWQADPPAYEAHFDAVGAIVAQVRDALAAGDSAAIGPLLDENQRLLAEIGVSSPELEQLIAAARSAGALGAKLSGAGWGGVMLALVAPERQAAVAESLREAGAAHVLCTTLVPSI